MDVVACADELADRGLYAEASSLFVMACQAVKPVPRILWRWGARRIDVLDREACLEVLELVRSERDVDVQAVCTSDDALEALLCFRYRRPLYPPQRQALLDALLLGVMDAARSRVSCSAGALSCLESLAFWSSA